MDYEIISTGSVKVFWQPHVPTFPSQLLVLAEETWKKRPKNVFNGSLFMHLNTKTTPQGVELVGAFTDYRFYYTQKKTQTDFDLRPIAVSGLLICGKQIIIGRRSPHVTSYAGWWELTPSGTLDLSVARDDSMVDYITKLTEEFTEETLLSHEVIQSIEAFAVIYDKNDGVFDIACEVQLNVRAQEVVESMQQSPEYSEAVAVSIADLPKWLAHNGDQLVPTSHAILSLWRK